MTASHNDVVRCPWCAKLTLPVWVHGHAQCQHCRTNIDPTHQPRKRRISTVKSPCIGTCMLFPRTQMCSGCFRTVDEVRDWIEMTDEERLAVIAQLEERREIHGPSRLPPDPRKR